MNGMDMNINLANYYFFVGYIKQQSETLFGNEANGFFIKR